jgi:predicted Zn-dependent peptidase
VSLRLAGPVTLSALAALLAATAVAGARGPAPAAPSATAPASAASAGGVRVPDYRRRVLPNGIVLLIMPIREVPLIAFSAVLRGGALADPQDRAGTASIAAGLLEKGAGGRDAFAFADAVADAGASFSAAAGTESISVGGQFLARDRDLMIELLADALLRPRLDAAEFESLRNRQVEQIKAAKDSEPQSLIRNYGRALLFGSHPYGTAVEGSERSLAALTPGDVQAYVRDQFGADRLILAFAGDVDVAGLEKAVTRAFAGMPRARRPPPALPPPARLAGRRVLLVDAPGSSQTYFWLANVGVARSYPQRAALDIVNTLYGGRFTSILNTELRIKSGLSYSASSSFSRRTVPGEFAIDSFTQTDNTSKALDLALQTLAGLKADPIAPQMLQSARSYVLGQYPLALETAAHWAPTLGDLEFFGLDRSWIEAYGPALAAVGDADARRVVAEAFPAPDDLAIVLIGDAALIRDTARRYGPVTEVPLAGGDYAPRG